jgi:transposase
MMRFYQPSTDFYCGVDLHAKTMYLCILDRHGTIHLHKNLRTDPDAFLRAVAPYRASLVVAVECLHCWYWLADLCAAEGIPFVLGHVLAMRAIHGGKTKNDKIDSEKIARLTQGGLLPQAYVYPAAQRGLRDLLRRRMRLVRLRAELYGHVQTLYRQANRHLTGAATKAAAAEATLPEPFADVAVQRNAEADLAMVGYYDTVIRDLEQHVLAATRSNRAKELNLLQTIPGIGPILALTLLYEVDTIDRFTTRQQFCSYSRLVYPRQESAGKQAGCKGRKMGNAYLKWAFSEAAVYAARFYPRIGAYLHRLESKYGPGKSKSLLAHKLGRAVYHMLRKGTVFDEDKFLRG